MKKFLIIGSLNAVTYKDVFPYIKGGEVWLGEGKNLDFYLPDGGIEKFGNIRWLTNIGKNNRKPLTLTEHYSPEKYPRYDNYEAIEVSRVKNIPLDFDGVMGVPLTFLDKNDERFEVIGIANDVRWIGDFPCYTIINGKKVYNRILIKKRG